MADQTVTAKFVADISSFQSNLRALQASARELKASAADMSSAFSQSSQGMQQMSQAASQADSSHRRLSSGANESRTSFLSLAGSAAEVFEEIGEVIGVVTQLIGALAKQRDSVKAAEQAFTSLSLSTATARKEMEAIAKLDSSKAYGQASMQQAILTMRRLGMEAKDAEKMIDRIANSLAAAGQGSENLQPIALKMRELSKQTTITVEDIDQLAIMGIESWKILEFQTGKTQKQIEQDIKTGAMSGQEAYHALFEGMQKDMGSAETKSKEFGASWNQLSTEVANSFGPMIDKLAEFIRMLADLEKQAHLVSGALKFIFAPGLLGADIGNFLGTGLRQTIFGHASGITDNPEAHWSLVGEEGPEWMFVPEHATIFPNGMSPFERRSSSGSMGTTLPAFSGRMSGGANLEHIGPLILQVNLDSKMIARQTFPHLSAMIREFRGVRK